MTADLRIHERHDLTTTDRAAKMVGVTPVTIRNWILGGRLGAERICGHYFPIRLEVEALARQRANAATEAAAEQSSTNS